jgi:hypothetical protein
MAGGGGGDGPGGESVRALLHGRHEAEQVQEEDRKRPTLRVNSEKRANPRLALTYPIEVMVDAKGHAGGTRGVTSNLSARGAYFKTFAWDAFERGIPVEIRILVPHPIVSGEESMQLHMATRGWVTRLDRVVGREALGEDGLLLKGVALSFERPLRFNYFWM